LSLNQKRLLSSNLMKAFHQGDWVHCKKFHTEKACTWQKWSLLIEKRLRHAHMPGELSQCEDMPGLSRQALLKGQLWPAGLPGRANAYCLSWSCCRGRMSRAYQNQLWPAGLPGRACGRRMHAVISGRLQCGRLHKRLRRLQLRKLWLAKGRLRGHHSWCYCTVSHCLMHRYDRPKSLQVCIF